MQQHQQRLMSWAIVRQGLPKPIVVARFRSRSDADGHLQCLRRLIPGADFNLIFDVEA